MVNVSQQGNTLLDKIVDLIIPPHIVAFLNQTLYMSSFIIINYWSFVHIISGIIFYFVKPKKYAIKEWFIIWFWANLIFEIAEYVLALGTQNPLFVEEFVDITADIIFGIIGFILVWITHKNKY